MRARLFVALLAVVVVVLCAGCPQNGPVQAEKVEDLSWQHVRLDTPDYFWTWDYVPDSMTDIAEEKLESAELTKAARVVIDGLMKGGLLGDHQIVFDPLVTKGQKADLSGSSTRFSGESQLGLSYVFCWALPGSNGREISKFTSILSSDRVVIRSPGKGQLPSVRFKYRLEELGELYSWVYENPGVLINEKQVVYAVLRITPRQAEEGYLGLR